MSLLLIFAGAGPGGGEPEPPPAVLAAYSRRMRRRVEDRADQLRPTLVYQPPTPDQEEDFLLWLLDIEDEPPFLT